MGMFDMASTARAGYGRGAPEAWVVLVQPEDAALVAEMVEGNRAALATLYSRYSGLMLAVGVRVLRDRGEAEEVLHDVFVEAFRSADSYDARRGSVRTWLLVRMRSRSLDRVKSAGRARRVSLDEQALARLPSPEKSGTGDERRIAEVLVQLPRDQRLVVELAYFDGLSSSEIAARLGVPIGTVKSRTAAALSKLRSAMGAP
jgi:RNA polymerase sigma-70 factor, ECF subfamily